MLVLSACTHLDTADQFRVGVGAATFPGAGSMVSLGQLVHESETAEWSAEVEVMWQPLSDESMGSSGPGRTGRYVQVRTGVRALWDPDAPEAWTTRLGAVFLRSLGKPDFLTLDGPYKQDDWSGFYGGIGRAYRVSDRFSIEPELAVMAVQHQGGFVHYFSLGSASVFAQALLHLEWRF